MATINNVDYSWSIIEITSAGTNGITSFSNIAPHITGIKWSTKRNIKTNYGLKGNPVGRGVGNVEYTASITIDETGLQLLREAAMAAAAAAGGTVLDSPASDLLNLGQFDIQVSWASESLMSTGITNTHTVTLEGCVFSDDGLDASQDATQLTTELNLNPFKISTTT